MPRVPCHVLVCEHHDTCHGVLYTWARPGVPEPDCYLRPKRRDLHVLCPRCAHEADGCTPAE